MSVSRREFMRRSAESAAFALLAGGALSCGGDGRPGGDGGVAERFCFDFIPKARAAGRGDTEVTRVIQSILDSPEHAWLKSMSAEDRAKIDAFYRERYGASVVK